MKKIYLSIFSALLFFSASAQDAESLIQPYGDVSKADLELKKCDFEPDANAEVLFDKADVYFDSEFNIVMERQKRIKVFNANGKKNADVRIEYYSFSRLEYVSGLSAQTINLENGKTVTTKVEKKQIFTENVDKMRTALVFTFPNVKPGSIIEYKYKITTTAFTNFPEWDFQEKIPVRYSELSTSIPEYFYYKPQFHGNRALDVHQSSTSSGSLGVGADALVYTNNVTKWGMKSVRSLPDEPFMTSDADNLMNVNFTLTQIRPPRGFTQRGADDWPRIGGLLADDEDFGKQLKKKLEGEDVLLAKAKELKTDEEKVIYLFNEVKKAMKWNGNDRWYTNEGTAKAWQKKTGNATEINLILYHLLNKAGVEVMPMVVSTRDHGKVNPYTPFVHQFNRGVVMVQLEGKKPYIMDASGKYNLYNETPDNLLNSTGLYLNMDKKSYDLLFLKKEEPVRKSLFVNAEVKPEGKIAGITQISLFSYSRVNALDQFNTDGKEKYTERLRNKNNNLKINSLEWENTEVDTLPLLEKLSFELNLPGAEGDYIYFNPNLFTGMEASPFVAESRYTDIEFGYRDNMFFTGMYKIPAGYAPETLPKSMSIVMPDQSMSFKRIVSANAQTISIRYVIDHAKTTYFTTEYADLREFYRQMVEMMNEPIALKKSS